MGGKARHAKWARLLDIQAILMKFCQGSSLRTGVAANLIQADHAIEAVERRIFNSFGHNWRSELLKPQQKFAFQISAHAQGKHVADEAEKSGIYILSAFPGLSYCRVYNLDVFIQDLIALRNDIGAINGKA